MVFEKPPNAYWLITPCYCLGRNHRFTAATLEKLVSTFEANMEKQGATFSKLPEAERAKWANTMPNIAQEWVKRNEERGVPAGAVLKTYLAKLRAAGQKPLRDWEKR